MYAEDERAKKALKEKQKMRSGLREIDMINRPQVKQLYEFKGFKKSPKKIK